MFLKKQKTKKTHLSLTIFFLLFPLTQKPSPSFCFREEGNECKNRAHNHSVTHEETVRHPAHQQLLWSQTAGVKFWLTTYYYSLMSLPVPQAPHL